MHVCIMQKVCPSKQMVKDADYNAKYATGAATHYARYLYESTAAPSMRSRYSRSMSDSMRFLIIVTSGLNCEASWPIVSMTSFWCGSSLRCLFDR
jgi:hypothetical protein